MIFHRGAVAGLLIVVGSTAVLATGDSKIRIRCRLEVGAAVTEPTTLGIGLSPIARNTDGTYRRAGVPEFLYVTLEPGSKLATADLETDLEVGATEYELQVTPLTVDGYARADGRYYFSGPKMVGEYPSDLRTLTPGTVNVIDVPLAWSKDASKDMANMLQVVPRHSGRELQMALSINDSTAIKIFPSAP